MSRIAQILAISRKDVESYYAKPPLITWGLLFPAVLVFAAYLRNPGTYAAVAPGIIAMTLLFGNTSMAAIVITFEKRAGTLERLLIAPLTHRDILLGKAASAAAFGIATSLVLYVGLAFFLGLGMDRPLWFALGLVLGGATFALLGLVASAMVREVFEAMTLMNLFRFPILFVSGVFMPIEDLPSWLLPVAMASPLTHVVELLRLGISGKSYLPGPAVPSVAMLGFLAVSWILAGPVFRRFANR